MRGGLNLYAYVNGNPINLIDPKGLAYSPAEHGGRYEGGSRYYQSQANKWLESNRDLSWLNSLPDCPCEKPNVNGNGAWVKEDTPGVRYIFHRGSTSCVRSKTMSGGHAQQCCYDAENKLITGGRGAGTPDKTSSPPGNFTGKIEHFTDDVEYFFGMDWSTYHEVRSPNNGNNCCENEL